MTDLLKKYGTSRNGHAIFAPSSSKMWMECAGSLLANFFAEDDAGVDAAYGTVAHEMAEIALNHGIEAAQNCLGETRKVVNGQREFDITIDSDMLHHVEGYANFCLAYGGDHFVETRIDLSYLFPISDQGGTVDHFVCRPGLLIVNDLKSGSIKVPADAPQVKIYAAGVVNEWNWLYGFKKVVTRIYQPWIGHFDEYEMDIDDLREFEEQVEIAARKAWVEDAPRRATPEGCRWCKDRLDCPARVQQVFELGQAMLDDMQVQENGENYFAFTALDERLRGMTFETVAAYKLSTPTLARLLLWKSFVTQWFNEAYAELNARITVEGHTDENWKVVKGRRSFKWKSEKLAKEKLVRLGLENDEIIVSKICSVSAAKDHLKARGIRGKFAEDILSGVVSVENGRATIAPVKDMRDQIEVMGADMLEDLTDREEEDGI